MGHRGCRLAVTYPSIAKMQTKAVIRAAIEVQKEHADWTVKPEIMIPLVCEVKELKYVKNIVVETADAEIAAAGVNLEYEVGTMIEIPRAALTADEIATEADFFCFGTNDLTQMTFGFSRDDAGKFLNAYYDKKIFESDPFAKLDQVGVGKLMEMAIKLGKPVNPKLHVGICGEHGGDPSSVEFCHKIGLDYVSCSPFRIPIVCLFANKYSGTELSSSYESLCHEGLRDFWHIQKVEINSPFTFAFIMERDVDCLFDSADLVMMAWTIFALDGAGSDLHDRTIYKPVTEKHPYGYAQVESLFLLVKYSVLLALTCNLMVENIKLLFHGGHEVDAGSIAVFEFLVCVCCAVMYAILGHYSKKYESTTIKAELYMWKLDVISSMGVAVAFAVQTALLHTNLRFITPYIDPAVAVVMALLLIKEPVCEIFQSIKNLILFAPEEEETLSQIRAIVDQHMKDYPYEVTFLDVIQTGRKLWVEVYIGNQTDVIHISIIHKVRDEIKQELRDKYDQVYIEVIPD